jgi:hypothetical protein
MPIGEFARPDEDYNVEELVDTLADGEGLTHSLVIRSLCMGCLNLFETGMARMADIPRSNARILLMGGHNGFIALYKAAYMPDVFAEAVEKLLEIALEITDYGCSKPEDFRKQVIEKIFIGGHHHKIEGMGYLLSIIDGKIQRGA